MPTYQITSPHEFGHGFEVSLGDEPVAAVVEKTKGEFEIRIGAERWRIAPTSEFGESYQLIGAEARVVATAARPSPIGPRFELETADRARYHVTPVATFGRKCHVVRDEHIVGFVDPDDLTTRETVAELPAELGVPESAFLSWIVLHAMTRER